MTIQPRLWEHKNTKKQVRALPWWECLEPLLTEKDAPNLEEARRKFKIGSLVQIGWLIENEHGMWLGVGPKAAKVFKDLGDAPARKVKGIKR